LRVSFTGSTGRRLFRSQTLAEALEVTFEAESVRTALGGLVCRFAATEPET
jgi:hypothetical protein